MLLNVHICLQGLVHVVADVLSKVEHRACASHISANWSKKHGVVGLQMKFLKTTWSTFEEEFTDNTKKRNEISSEVVRPSWLTHLLVPK